MDQVTVIQTIVSSRMTEVGNAGTTQPVAGSFREAEVAVLYDWDNHWALQEIQGLHKKPCAIRKRRKNITAISGNRIFLWT